jgi:RNA polymerase sigma factor (sigma-70 family)
MATGQLSTVLRHLHRLAGATGAAEASDAQLLERFAARRDEAAFTALVHRHGPMVLGVCQRVLGNVHDAEDAFQATFLILVRKAGTIGKGASVGAWLHGVAHRAALRVRSSLAARRAHERRTPTMPDADFLAAVAWRDLAPVLDEEVRRLPERCRDPFVLCYLEGHTYEAAGRRLACATGTVSRRLAQARDLLRRRLARRGLALPAGVLGLALSENAACAVMPATLAASTVKAALRSAADSAGAAGAVSPHVAALVEGGTSAMNLFSVKTILAALLAVALLGAGLFALHTPAQQPAEDGNARPAKAPAAVKAKAAPAQTDSGPAALMTVTGRVEDMAGKPVAGADVAVLGRRKPWGRSDPQVVYARLLGRRKADAQGRYRLRVPRTSREGYYETYVLARAAGYAVGQRPFDADAKEPKAPVFLAPEQVLRGRVLDLQGQPAAKARVVVLKVVSNQLAPPQRVPAGLPVVKFVSAEFDELAEGLGAWVPPVTADAQGRFSLHGLGEGWSATLQVLDDRFTKQMLVINPQGWERQMIEQLNRAGGSQPFLQAKPRKDRAEDFTWTLKPARIFQGKVTYADTGKPVAGARLVVFAGKQYFSLMSVDRCTGRTDANGRFRLVPKEGKNFMVLAYPPAGQPYLLQTKSFQLVTSEVVKQTLDFALPRGINVHGTITEKGSGKPVAGASVEYVPRSIDNKYYRQDAIGPSGGGLKQIGISDAEGKFRVTTLPGPGHLLINGPMADYLRVETSQRYLSAGKAGGRRYYPNALVPLDLKAEMKRHRADVTLRRGVTVRGKLVGPDGKPVKVAVAFTRSYIPFGYTLEGVYTMPVQNGRFEVRGLDPDKPQAVYFLAAAEQLAKIVHLPAKGAGEKPLTVRLERCGTATLRFVDAKGKPAAGNQPFVEVIITPGVSFFEALQGTKLAADAAWMINLDRQRHQNLKPDAQGRFTLPTLIPGATCRLLGQSPQRGIFDLHKTFTVQAGKNLDLKDIPISKPPQ